MDNTLLNDAIQRLSARLEITSTEFSEYRKELKDHNKELHEHRLESQRESQAMRTSITKLEEHAKHQKELMEKLVDTVGKNKIDTDLKIDDLKKRQNKLVIYLSFACGVGYVLLSKASSFFIKILPL